MSLLETISLLDLRGYPSLDVAFAPGPHLIWGPNAAGKTSLLEAMVLLAWGRSHRTTADGELIRWGTDLARVEGRVGARRHRGGDRPVRGVGIGGAQADPGERPAPPRDRPGRTAPGRGLRAGGDAADRRLAVAPPRGDRPAGVVELAGLRRRPGDLRPDAPAAQQPAPRDPRGGRRARRAALLGRSLPRLRGGHRDRASPPARGARRTARRRPRRDRPGRGVGGPADARLRHERSRRSPGRRRGRHSPGAWRRPPTRRSGTARR